MAAPRGTYVRNRTNASFQMLVKDRLDKDRTVEQIQLETRRSMAQIIYAVEAIENERRDADEQRKRKCLTCGKPFPSKWIGNRICRGCGPVVERRSSAMDNDSGIGWSVRHRGVR